MTPTTRTQPGRGRRQLGRVVRRAQRRAPHAQVHPSDPQRRIDVEAHPQRRHRRQQAQLRGASTISVIASAQLGIGGECAQRAAVGGRVPHQHVARRRRARATCASRSEYAITPGEAGRARAASSSTCRQRTDLARPAPACPLRVGPGRPALPRSAAADRARRAAGRVGGGSAERLEIGGVDTVGTGGHAATLPRSPCPRPLAG